LYILSRKIKECGGSIQKDDRVPAYAYMQQPLQSASITEVSEACILRIQVFWVVMLSSG